MLRVFTLLASLTVTNSVAASACALNFKALAGDSRVQQEHVQEAVSLARAALLGSGFELAAELNVTASPPLRLPSDPTPLHLILYDHPSRTVIVDDRISRRNNLVPLVIHELGHQVFLDALALRAPDLLEYFAPSANRQPPEKAYLAKDRISEAVQEIFSDLLSSKATSDADAMAKALTGSYEEWGESKPVHQIARRKNSSVLPEPTVTQLAPVDVDGHELLASARQLLWARRVPLDTLLDASVELLRETKESDRFLALVDGNYVVRVGLVHRRLLELVEKLTPSDAAR